MFDFNNFHILQDPYETQGAKNLAGLAGSFQIKSEQTQAPYSGASWMSGVPEGRSASAIPNMLGQNFSNMDPAMQGQVAGGIAGGVAGIVGGIVGGRARRQEQKAAKAELAQRQREYEGFEFKDPSAGMTNPFEDLTVNQQQAQFEAQQSQQGLASTLSGLQGAAGGSGIAALAQAMAGQQQQNIQRASASIGQQEQANQIARAQGQQNLEAQRSAGQQYVQQQEFGRTSTLLEAAAGRKMAADQARAQATQSIVGGVGELVGAGASLAMPGL